LLSNLSLNKVNYISVWNRVCVSLWDYTNLRRTLLLHNSKNKKLSCYWDSRSYCERHAV